jgi:integrase
MNVKINEQSIGRIKKQAPEAGNVIVWDTELPSLGVRVTAAGAVSYVLDYRLRGKQRRFTIGRYPEMTATAARNKAIELRKGIADGIDPIDEKEKLRKQRDELANEPTVGKLLDDYLASDALAKKRPNTLRDYKRMMENVLRPRLGSVRLKAVTKSDIEALHAALKDTPYQANRVLALLSSLFSFAMEDERQWVDRNPVIGIERFPEQKRERYLNQEDATEIKRFTKALDSYPDQNAANALRLLLLTGARMSEALKADWSQFNLTRETWTKPSHHTKQKKTEHVPLSKPALELLKSMKPQHARGPLFVGRDGKRARVGIRRPWIAACKAAGLVEVVKVEGKRKTKDGKPRMVNRYKPTVRIHDLRHTFASHLASSGVSLQVIGKLIGHTQIATTMRYSHLQDEALRNATNQPTAIVIAFDRKRA